MADQDDHDAALELASEFNRTIDAVKFLRNELQVTLMEAVSFAERAASEHPQSALAIARRMGG